MDEAQLRLERLRPYWASARGSLKVTFSRRGATNARLIDDAGHLDWSWFSGIRSVGLTAGASAPDLLVEDVIDTLSERFDVQIEEVAPRRENVTFKLPRALAQ